MIAGTWNLTLSHTQRESELPPGFPSFSSSSSWSSWPIQHILQFPSINNYELLQPARYQLQPPSPGSDRDLTQIQHCRKKFTLQHDSERSSTLFTKKNTHIHAGFSHQALDVCTCCAFLWPPCRKSCNANTWKYFMLNTHEIKILGLKLGLEHNKRKSSLDKSSSTCPSGKANGLQEVQVKNPLSSAVQKSQSSQ